MKYLTCLALAAVAAAQQLVTDAPTVEKNDLGYLIETTYHADGFKKVINQPLVPFHQDYASTHDFIVELTNKHMMLGTDPDGTQPIYDCTNRIPQGDKDSAGALLPVYVASLTEKNATASYTNSACFDGIDFQFEKVDDNTFNVHIKTGKKKGGVACRETFIFANTEIFHLELFAFKGDHTLTFKTTTPEAQADMNFGGLKVYQSCDGIVDIVKSAWKTAKCFLGGLSDHPNIPFIGSHVPQYMEDANIEFLHTTMQYDMEKRTTFKVDYDPTLIQDGDMMAVMRLDGLDQIIMYGTGAYVGHNTMALRFDGELYIVESQDAWYWPTANLQRTIWADWIKQAEDASFHVSHLPLRKDIRANFDNAKAVAFFNETAGLPYGYHNFLYGWIDTPRDNLPPLLPNEFVPILFSIVEMVAPKTAQNFFTEALNMRLGTKDLDIAHVAAEAAKKNMSLQELMAVVEQDGWEYHGIEPRDGRSWVCSAYVAAMYKAAGLFGDMDINSTEFGPADVYELDFFDTKFELPQACKDADPDLPYCQLLGHYRMKLPHYSTVKPYAHMNEKCGRIWPEYTRPENC
jgi:hypothetical protein